MNSAAHITELIRKRDEKGISLLYDKYAKALLGISFRIVEDKTIAEDVLNKSFLKIWNNIDKYDEEKGTLFTWMGRIIKNSSLDARRSKFFVQQRKTDSIISSSSTIEAEEISTAKLDTDNLLKGLEEKYRIVLDYLYLRGYTQKELSDELSIPIGTIKTRLKKAMDILRKDIGQEKSINSSLKKFTILLITILLP